MVISTISAVQFAHSANALDISVEDGSDLSSSNGVEHNMLTLFNLIEFSEKAESEAKLLSDFLVSHKTTVSRAGYLLNDL